jgi:hypothetical protein
MKTTKMTLLLVAMLTGLSALGQMTLNYPDGRIQYLNQYTSVFISSPNNNTIIQNVRNQSGLGLVDSDKYQLFNQSINNYQQISQSASTLMVPGQGYVLQLGGNGTS